MIGDCKTTDPYTTIVKNRLENTLDTKADENQSAASLKKIDQSYIL